MTGKKKSQSFGAVRYARVGRSMIFGMKCRDIMIGKKESPHLESFDQLKRGDHEAQRRSWSIEKRRDYKYVCTMTHGEEIITTKGSETSIFHQEAEGLKETIRSITAGRRESRPSIVDEDDSRPFGGSGSDH
ncbi:unnamed protein product [Cuscuta epithymum]|uniref:Uncharacterized protein n=1 Tax=Cuscuta epithymum TaxID=186058 RepID=A0AAV0F4Y2_9ASTE|nr:unnamed protein product [Cuscuta epithymum]